MARHVLAHLNYAQLGMALGALAEDLWAARSMSTHLAARGVDSAGGGEDLLLGVLAAAAWEFHALAHRSTRWRGGR